MNTKQHPGNHATGYIAQFCRTRLGLLALPLLLAFGAPALQAGDIEGFISDANTGRFLPGVEVVVVGEDRSTVTDRDGSYRIAGLPAGTYTVEARYISYDSVSESVTVPSTGSASASMEIGLEFVELEAYRVEGYREARSLALQQKRTANNVLDVISADSVGSLPDRNVAEALARVPGINLDVDAGEGRFVSIRGLEPNFNNVTIDGATIAAPAAGGREGRAMPLDVVGSGQIYQIEVIKAVTPDMDGNALGGTINIKSTSAFDQPDGFVFGKLEIGEDSEGTGTLFDGDITWGDTFNDGKVGISLSAHYSERPFTSHEIQASYGDEDGRYFVETFELQPAEGERERTGINYNIEFHPDADSEFYIRGIFNQFDESERQQEYIMDTRRDPEFLTPTAADFNRMRIEQRDFRREIDQSLFSFSTGGHRQFENVRVEGSVNYSESEEDVPFIKSIQFRTGNENFIEERFFYEFAGLYPNFDDKGFTSDRFPEEWGLRRFREDDSFSKEETMTIPFDIEWENEDFLGGRTTFKTGIKITTRDRFVDDNSTRPNGDFDLSDFATPSSGSGFDFYDGRYRYPNTLDVLDALDFLNSNRSQFEIDPVESTSNSVEDDYDISEDILAAYFMGTIQATPDLTLIAGVRWEETDASLKSFEFQEGEIADPEDPEDTIDVFNLVETEGEFKYDNILPHLHAKYDIDANTLLRASINGTIGRPQYERASPNNVFEYEEIVDEDDLADLLDPDFPFFGELEQGNPELEPYESMNFELSLEHYLESGGLLAAGIFHKEIDNPIYEFQEDLDFVVRDGIPFERLETSQWRNADEGEITGFEIAAVLPFTTFVEDGFLDGFGIDLNATFIDSDVTVFERTGEGLPFFRQPERIYNVAFYYQKHGLASRIAWNYQDESLRELSGGSDSDRWDDTRDYVDFQASYNINDNYTIYLNWQNIFKSEKIRTYGRSTNRLRRGEFYGSYVRAGVRFNWR